MNPWAITQWILLILAAPAAGYFLRSWRHGKVQTAYGLILIFGFIWAAGQHILNCVILFRPGETAFRAALLLCYSGMCALGPACVYLGWCYAGKFRHYRSRGKVAALFGFGAFFYLAILTNDLHYLYYTQLSLDGRSYGALFYLFTAFSYACFIYSYFTIQRARWDAQEHSSLLFLLCFVPPVAANTWGMIADRSLDFTPLAFCVMLLGVYLIIWRHRPLSLAPIAARTVFDSIGHPVRINAPDGLSSYFNGAKPRCGHTYRDVKTPLDDGNTLLIRTDITHYHSLQKELEAQRAELEKRRLRLSDQARELSRQAETAALLAAEQRRMEIMSLLDREVREKLEDIRGLARDTVVSPDIAHIEEGQRLSSEALELVRQIVREIKRRPWDGL